MCRLVSNSMPLQAFSISKKCVDSSHTLRRKERETRLYKVCLKPQQSITAAAAAGGLCSNIYIYMHMTYTTYILLLYTCNIVIIHSKNKLNNA